MTAESLVGRWVAFKGEAAMLGRVHEVVARRDGYALLSLEVALPWEVLARYQEEVDLGVP